jgi:hypothetical protein
MNFLIYFVVDIFYILLVYFHGIFLFSWHILFVFFFLLTHTYTHTHKHTHTHTNPPSTHIHTRSKSASEGLHANALLQELSTVFQSMEAYTQVPYVLSFPYFLFSFLYLSFFCLCYTSFIPSSMLSFLPSLLPSPSYLFPLFFYLLHLFVFALVVFPSYQLLLPSFLPSYISHYSHLKYTYNPNTSYQDSNTIFPLIYFLSSFAIESSITFYQIFMYTLLI